MEDGTSRGVTEGPDHGAITHDYPVDVNALRLHDCADVGVADAQVDHLVRSILTPPRRLPAPLQ
jgi:hypothetical protein